jgi:nucleoredoxin
MKLSVLVALLLLCGVGAVFAEPLAPTLKNDLVVLDGKKVRRFDDGKLASAKYVAVYYSAHWCPPCRAFTPDLVKWYEKTKAEHPEFELVFVSSDEDEKAMEKYMAEAKMPWPALRYGKKAQNKSLTVHGGAGIPCLVLLDADGKVLSNSFVDGKYVGPRKVLEDMDQLFAGGSGQGAKP